MPQEGQTAIGPNGERAVFRNGRWVVEGGASSTPTVMQVPESAQARAERERNDAAAGRDTTRTGIAVEQNVRSVEKQSFDFTAELRKEFNSLPEVKEYQTVIRQYASALKTQPTPSGDQALITAYAKMLDPGSVVREQEFAVTADSDSYLGQLEARLKKNLGMDGAGRFRPEIRQRVREEMRNLVDSYAAAYDQARTRYGQAAQGYGVDPAQVIGPDLAEPYKAEIDKFWTSGAGSALNQDQGGVVPPGGFASGGDEGKSIPIPAEMQAEFEAYVHGNRGNLNPQEYAAFRAGLNEKYGFGQTPPAWQQTYLKEAEELNRGAREGIPLNLTIPAADAKMTTQDRINSTIFNNPAGGFALGVADITGGIDEAAAGVSSLMNGTPYGVELDRANAVKQQLAGEYPVANIAGNLAGSLGTGALLAKGAPQLVSKLAASPAQTAAAGGLIGAGQGALEANENRSLGAGAGFGLGAGGGYAGQKFIAPAIERALRGTSGAPKLSGAEQTVASALDPEGIDFARNNIADATRLSLPFTLADSAPKLRALAGSATRVSPDALANFEGTLEQRSLGQVERANQAINQFLAPTDDLTKRAELLRQAGSISSAPKYAKAFSMDAPIDENLASILATPAGQDALKRGREIALNAGRSPDEPILSVVDEFGEGMAAAPKFETLDLVKKGLDAKLQENANPITGKIDFTGRPDLQAIEALRQRLVSQLDEINPDYKDARATYANFAKRAEALGQGKAAKARNVPLRDLERATSGMEPDVLPEFRIGYATGLADDATNASLGRNPYKTIFGSAGQREKIGSLFPQGAEQFGRIDSLEEAMAKTAQEVLGGSATARRGAADDAFAPSLIGDVVQDAGLSIATGTPIPAATGRAGVRAMFGNMRQFGIGDSGRQRAAEVADILLSPAGSNLERIMAARAAQLQAEEAIRRKLALGIPLALPALGGPLIPGVN